MHAAHPDLRRRHQPVGAIELGAEREFLAPRPVQAHVRGDEAERAEAEGGEDDHQRGADEWPAGHQGATGWKHWSAQKTRHIWTQSLGLLPGSFGCPMPLITEASSVNSCEMPGASFCTTPKTVAASPR